MQTGSQREDLAGRFSPHHGLGHLEGIGRPWRMNLAPIATTVRLPRTLPIRCHNRAQRLHA